MSDYKNFTVQKLYESGIAQKIIDSRGKEKLKIDILEIIDLLGNHGHRDIKKNHHIESPNYFNFIKSYLKFVTLEAYEKAGVAEGRIQLNKKGVEMDKQSIEAFCVGWQYQEIKK